LIGNLEDWTRDVLTYQRSVDDAEIRHSFIDPLVQQVASDGGDSLAGLAQHRLGLHGPVESVRQAADRLGCTRSHIYDLLDEIATILTVRWPEGAVLMQRLSDVLVRSPESCQKKFAAALSLFFPVTRDLPEPSLSRPKARSSIARHSDVPGIAPDNAKEYNATHSQLAYVRL
jgi:hypothetical protein